MNTEFFRQISEKNQISDFRKIRPVGTELFYTDGKTDGRTDRRDQDNSLFPNFVKASKIAYPC